MIPGIGLGMNVNGDFMYATGQLQYGLPFIADTVLYKSTNYGVTWSPTSIAPPAGTKFLKCALSTNGQYITLYNGYVVLVSNNYGASFSTKTPGVYMATDIKMSSNGQVQALVFYDKIYISTDYGDNWLLRTDGCVYHTTMYMSNDGAVMIVSDGLSDAIIRKSTDYGANWTTIVPNLMLRSPALTGNSVNMLQSFGGINGCLYSTNGGVTWTPSSNNVGGLVCNARNSSYVFVGSVATLYRSLGGGGYSNVDLTYGITGITSSSDGKYVTVVTKSVDETSGHVYASTDYGVTFTDSTQTRPWIFVASNQ